VWLPFVILKPPVRGERKEQANRKMGEGAKKLGPAQMVSGVFNCPQPHGRLETLE
jgi:hypothetical protein